MYVVFSAMVVFTILNLIYADFNLKKIMYCIQVRCLSLLYYNKDDYMFCTTAMEIW